MSSDQSPIGAVAQNTRTILTDVPAGGYYIVITSADGKIDPNVKYTFSLILLPPNVIDITKYEGMLSQSGKQLIEFLEAGAIKDLKRNVLFINRKEFDPQFINFATGRADSDHSCYGLGKPTSECLRKAYGPGIYESDLINCNNALIISIADGLYSWTMRATFSTYEAACSTRYGVPDDYTVGTDKYGMRLYRCVWFSQPQYGEMQFVIDIDKMDLATGEMGVIDIYYPNYFYGFDDGHGSAGNYPHKFTFK